jgi:hypothetical protein
MAPRSCATALLLAAVLLALLATGADALAGRHRGRHKGRHKHRNKASDGHTDEAIKRTTHRVDPGKWISANDKVLSVDHLGFDKRAEDLTALVTFAGQSKTEYIDAAVMLAHSLKKHAPGYPMLAIAIEGMQKEKQELLERAGWQVVFVQNWEDEYCADDCNQEFMKRWHDSFEKINIFRLGLGKVLFFDADTYVFSGRVNELLNSFLEPGHIAMAPDGCKSEYNSGVMLFRPEVAVFRQMLELVVNRSREQVLDQNLINAAYAGKITELDREFNCVDTMGVQPGVQRHHACQKKCSANVVVSHFTGHPKPTAAKRRLLASVRRPESPETTCKNTNFGSCSKWSEYYCDLLEHRKTLSKSLHGWLRQTGGCCHTPYNPQTDEESCQNCPAQLRIAGGAPFPDVATGSFMRSILEPTKYNGGKPVYVRAMTSPSDTPTYLYYVQKQVMWMVGPNYTSNRPHAFALLDATCPRDVQRWHAFTNNTWTQMDNVSVVSEGFAWDTMLWDPKLRKWVSDHGVNFTHDEDFEQSE